MNNPNRNTTTARRFFTKSNVIMVIISLLLVMSLATIWVGYNQITERNNQIDTLSNKVVEIDKKLEEANKIKEELDNKILKQEANIVSLNEELSAQKKANKKLAEDRKTVLNENAELTKKYRELVKP